MSGFAKSARSDNVSLSSLLACRAVWAPEGSDGNNRHLYFHEPALRFSWNAASLIAFRFVQGIGTGGEAPVASAYINEFAAAKGRGPFFLLYEVLFVVGLSFAAILGRISAPGA